MATAFFPWLLPGITPAVGVAGKSFCSHASTRRMAPDSWQQWIAEVGYYPWIEGITY